MSGILPESDWIASASALLQRLLAPASDDAWTLAQALAELRLAFRATSAGLLWPADDEPAVRVTDGPEAAGEAEVSVPFEGPRGLAGQLWLRRPAARPWGEDDRAFLALAGRILGGSPQLAAAASGLPDSVRLAERLRDCARVAGRIAHDFDNVLQGVVGFADLALALLSADAPARQYVAELLSVGQQGMHLTQQVHQFSRSGTARPLPTPPGAVLAAEAARVRPLLPPNGSLQMRLPIELPAVAIDTESLRQVFAHLLDNAREAQPAEGPVAVTTRVRPLSAAEAATFAGDVRAGPHVEVTVEDAGPGVNPEIRPRLLAEPFVTTKPRHRGLGLAVCFRILYAHQAGLRLEANAPRGTIVRVVLPASSTVRSP